MRWLTRLRYLLRPELPAKEAELTEADISHLKDLLRLMRNQSAHGTGPRTLTYDQLVRAAWANLAIENPEVTLEEARRVIDQAWPDIAKSVPDLRLEEDAHVPAAAR